MNDVRCPYCKKLLFKGTGNVQIKCGGCKKIVTIKIVSQKALLTNQKYN